MAIYAASAAKSGMWCEGGEVAERVTAAGAAIGCRHKWGRRGYYKFALRLNVCAISEELVNETELA